MSFLPFSDSSDTVSEYLIGYVTFSGHSTHGEMLLKLSLILEPVNFFLATFVGTYKGIQLLLMTAHGAGDTVND